MIRPRKTFNQRCLVPHENEATLWKESRVPRLGKDQEQRQEHWLSVVCWDSPADGRFYCRRGWPLLNSRDSGFTGFGAATSIDLPLKLHSSEESFHTLAKWRVMLSGGPVYSQFHSMDIVASFYSREYTNHRTTGEVWKTPPDTDEKLLPRTLVLMMSTLFPILCESLPQQLSQVSAETVHLHPQDQSTELPTSNRGSLQSIIPYLFICCS